MPVDLFFMSLSSRWSAGSSAITKLVGFLLSWTMRFCDGKGRMRITYGHQQTIEGQMQVTVSALRWLDLTCSCGAIETLA